MEVFEHLAKKNFNVKWKSEEYRNCKIFIASIFSKNFKCVINIKTIKLSIKYKTFIRKMNELCYNLYITIYSV